MNISTHAPRTGSDKDANWLARLVKISTHAPRTGSDTMFGGRQSSLWNFNPRSPHGERHWERVGMGADRTISTHAPRTGSDLFGLKQMQACQRDFNPRSPHGERLAHTAFFHHAPIFQPTLPARGATAFWGRMLPFSRHISTHAPRTGSDVGQVVVGENGQISTHAPRTGSDLSPGSVSPSSSNISTHAPRTGSDFIRLDSVASTDEFQPTLPARGATC